MAIDSRILVQAFATSSAREYKDDPAGAPLDYAQSIAKEGTPFSSPEYVLAGKLLP
jgi:hypothetical protein